jgi:4-amino-4-deoxy-L-arabinose transferase-like glycosyltransferase
MTWQAVRHALRDERLGWLVLLAAAALYLPGAGSYGLWDPWETHYGEVARQMTARGDYISLWWPGSPREIPVFQTKPVLSFWLMSLAMHVAGIGSAGAPPGEMALGTAAEWALRTPFCLLGALGVWAVYLLVARLASRRAGVLAAVATASFPMYALVARQAMTDMAFVGPMTLALALGALALEEPPDEPPLPRRGRGRLCWPHHPLFYAGLTLWLLVTVPQLLADSIDLRVRMPWQGRTLTLYGIAVMWPYWVGVLLVPSLMARARRRAPLQLFIAAVLCGLAVLGKGLAGLALPVIIFAVHAAVSGRWRRLADRDLALALPVCLLAVAVVAIPWHHAMYVRHGQAWLSELFGDNHWRRLMIGRHGDRGTFEYFLRELGYGAWPLVALVPAALAGAFWAPAPDPGRRVLLRFGAVWFVTSYALVSLSMTKFHHYLLPALPGLGILIGLLLDRLLEARAVRPAALAAMVGLPLLAAVTFDLVAARDGAERFLWLFSYDYIHNPAGRAWPADLDFRPALLVLAGGCALAVVALAWPRFRTAAVIGICVVALASAGFLIDGFMPQVAPYWSQKQVVAHYYRARSGPDERLIAYYLFWRGETFYTANEIYAGPEEERTVFDYRDDTDTRLRDWLARHRGRRQFFLFEPARQARLRSLLPPEAQASFAIIDHTHTKFVLAVAQL